jgi:hypothetical protein
LRLWLGGILVCFWKLHYNPFPGRFGSNLGNFDTFGRQLVVVGEHLQFLVAYIDGPTVEVVGYPRFLVVVQCFHRFMLFV